MQETDKRALLKILEKVIGAEVARNQKYPKQDPLKNAPTAHIKVMTWALANETDLPDNLKDAVRISRMAKALRKTGVGAATPRGGRALLLEPVTETSPGSIEEQEILDAIAEARRSGWLPPEIRENAEEAARRGVRVSLSPQRLQEIAQRLQRRREQGVSSVPQTAPLPQGTTSERQIHYGNIRAALDLLDAPAGTPFLETGTLTTDPTGSQREVEVNPHSAGRATRALASRVALAIDSLTEEYYDEPPRVTIGQHASNVFQAFSDRLDYDEIGEFMDGMLRAYHAWIRANWGDRPRGID